jgi:hypothetical protein
MDNKLISPKSSSLRSREWDPSMVPSVLEISEPPVIKATKHQVDSRARLWKETMALKKKNILIFFISLIEEMGPKQRSVKNLQFIRKICQFEGRGLSINQETIFKLIKLNPNFEKSIFVPLFLKDNKLYCEFKK